MELHQIRYFLALARSLNFTRAAEECNVTQPALTKAIQKLEQELGGALIHRERRLTQLTDLGKLVLPTVRRTLAAADAVLLSATEFHNRGVAPLKIALAPCVSATLLTQPLAQLTQVIPRLRVELIEASAERLPDVLMEGEVDAALAGRIGDLPDRIDHWPLFEERFVVLTAADDPLARLCEIPIEALANAVWLEHVGCKLVERFHSSCLPKQGEPKIQFRGRQQGHLQHMVAAGMGIMLAPEHAPHLQSLVARRIAGDPLRQHVGILVAAGRRYTPALDAFVKISRLRDWRADFESPPISLQEPFETAPERCIFKSPRHAEPPMFALGDAGK